MSNICWDAELGYHCCYCNLNLKLFVEPIDVSDMVEVMNSVTDWVGRPVAFVRMAVPNRQRSL